MCAHPRHRTFAFAAPVECGREAAAFTARGRDPKRRLRRRTPNRAFTLVELLTVVMILVLLIAMLVPSITKVRQIAMIKMTQATINSLETGCILYANDFGRQAGDPSPYLYYPPSQDTNYSGWYGSQLLALYLQGYGPDPGGNGTPDPSGRLDVADGKEGPGFRIEARGKVYGPYAEADKLPYAGTYWDPSMPGDRACSRFFVDAFDRPIVYYRFTGSGYNPADNGVLPYHPNASMTQSSIWPTPGPTKDPYSAAAAGSVDLYARDNVTNGKFLRTDFLLISRGPDGAWSWSGPVSKSDDVTNMFPNR
jgi:type II secretory pathway pseudopilin PulG